MYVKFIIKCFLSNIVPTESMVSNFTLQEQCKTEDKRTEEGNKDNLLRILISPLKEVLLYTS